MTFDKTRVMRNAERYLAQGKIRLAIGEYEQVIANDPRDIGTRNTLGDMYAKESRFSEAIECYDAVADHYATQGFSQKAIAVYNKILKLEPGKIEVSARLAELYRSRGSLGEARVHYTKLSEHYQKSGQKLEALAVWKQMALLDPYNTEVYLHLGEAYLKEQQVEEAIDAFAEAGIRLANQAKHASAVEAFNRALELRKDNLRVLEGFIRSKAVLGHAEQAAETLAAAVEEFPHSRELRVLHIDCLLGAGDIFGAEREVIKLVELEPANYPKFLELAGRYLEIDDTVSAARILSMSSEHMLVGGQADDFHGLVAQVLDKDPENLEGLRLMTRFCTWQKDEAPLRTALARLAEAAHAAEAVDDERYALLQLVMLVPQNIEYKQRLREINDLHGYEQLDEDENLFEQHFLGGGYSTIDPSQVSFESSDGEAITFETESAGEAGFEFVSADPQVSELFDGSADEEEPQPVSAAAIGREMKLQKEVDSIRFYIDNGYIELAAKATAELRHEFGGRSEVVGLEADIVRSGGILEAAEAEEVAAEEHGSAVYFEAVAEAPDVIQDTIGTGQPEFSSSGKIEMDQLRSELGLDDPEADDGSGDYETHYNTAVAYREMGLLEEAIKAFQDAVTLTGPADGTRRFFSCANMLGHCFMEKQMPQLALRWFQKALESSDLTDEERQGIWYELAGAYEAGGDTVNAGRYFEQVYAENVNFRDVSERVRSLSVNR